MPLRKRLESELRPDWRSHSIRYKDLQREAENLVGQEENEELEYVFRSHITFALEQSNEFYVQKKEQVMTSFDAVSHAVDAIAQVHHEREKKFMPHSSSEKDLMKDIISPTNSTDHMWPTRTAEEIDAMASAFHVWLRAARERRQHTIHLSDFVNPAFMARLEEGALKAALLDWLKLLTLIDHLRTFALLNAVAAIKLVERHCSEATRVHCRAAMDTLPMMHMVGLGELMQRLEGVAARLAACLTAGAVGPGAATPTSPSAGAPSTWSPHVCPFCMHTVNNAVVLPGGRTCCWGCAVKNSSNTIVQCPLSNKPVDLRGLRVERILCTFLRQYFPSAYRSAQDDLIGIGLAEARKAEEKAAVGIMSMRAQARKPAAPTLSAAPVSHRAPAAAAAAARTVSTLTTIADGRAAPPPASPSASSRGGHGHAGRGKWRRLGGGGARRDRGLSLESEPAEVDLGSLGDAVSEILHLLNVEKDAFDWSAGSSLGRPPSLRGLSSAGGAGGGERRDRSISLPCPPPPGELDLDALAACAAAGGGDVAAGPRQPLSAPGGRPRSGLGGAKAGLGFRGGSCKDLASLAAEA